MNRITEKDLKATVDRINRATDSPIESVQKTGTQYEWQIGNYHLSFAYGGVSLHRVVGVSGGVSDVFRCGHTTKRDLYERMHAFLAGLEAKQSIAA